MRNYEQNALSRIRGHLAECMVLLKKDDRFPLSAPCRLAAFGNGVRHTVKGGTGSGEVNSRFFITAEQGLLDAGFSLTSVKWLNAYDRILEQAKTDFVRRIKAEARAKKVLAVTYAMGKSMTEPEYALPLTEEGDAAIYILSRNAGEGDDRHPIEGDLRLTLTEIRDILTLNRLFDKFMLVLNVGAPVDLSPVMSVKNILLLSQLGVETGTALAEVLLGRMNPSGRLTSTWAAAQDYPGAEDFPNPEETRYREGIYVGYRYFDSFGIKPLFPFGFGLSYTEFSTTVSGLSADHDRITVRAKVKNLGAFPGKDVAELYLTTPSGRLDQPAKQLCAFEKTELLAPGESSELTLSFRLSDFASYDTALAAYILDPGSYVLRLGRSSGFTRPLAVIELEEEIVTLKARNILPPVDFQELSAAARAEDLSGLPRFTLTPEDFTPAAVDYELPEEILPEIDALRTDELCRLNMGAVGVHESSVIGNASVQVCGAAGESCRSVRGIPGLVMADGPAGLRLTQSFFRDEHGAHPVGNAPFPGGIAEYLPAAARWAMKTFRRDPKLPAGTEIQHQYCTAIPIGTAVAQSWNLSFAEELGDIVGNEMELFGVHLWLAPALNIHRSPLCGRNFEYFSEDPLLSGRMAAALTRGVQQHPGCGTTIKHFACNNKELNRYGNNSILSERALREIYTRGFGICVRESQPKCVMTSYNLLCGTHTSEHRGLLQELLRAEYGFRGLVMSDWVIRLFPVEGRYRNALADHAAAAGNDVFMPGSGADLAQLKKGLKKGTVTLKQLKINASRLRKLASELTEL